MDDPFDPLLGFTEIRALCAEFPWLEPDVVKALYVRLVRTTGTMPDRYEARRYVERIAEQFSNAELRRILAREAQDRAKASRPADPPPRSPDGAGRGQRQSLDGQDPSNPAGSAYLISKAAGLDPAGLSNAELLAMSVRPYAAELPARRVAQPKSEPPPPIGARVDPRSRGTPPPRGTPSAKLIVDVPSPPSTAGSGPPDPRYLRLEEAGRAAVRAWITHPAVGREVAAAKPALDRLLEPFVLPDQWAVTLVAARFLDVAGRYPDGTTWPDPFLEAPAAIVASARRIAPLVVEELSALAQRLAEAGVPLDPLDRSVLLVLAQLALLDIDLAHLTRELVDGLIVLPPGWIDRASAERGHVTTGASRHGRTARFRADIGSIGEDVARDLSPLGSIPAPYAGGGRRNLPAIEHRQEARREALREVLHSHPAVTAGRLRATWPAGPSTPGGLMRTHLGHQPDDPPPGESTLRADLESLRR